MFSGMKHKKSYNLLRLCIDFNWKLKKIIMFFLCFLMYSNDFLIPMPVPNPFGSISQTYQIQWILVSSTSEQVGHDVAILMLPIKSFGKPFPNLSQLTTSSVRGLLALLGSDFSYSGACHKSLWNPISTQSNAMESDVWHIWAPGILSSYSEALHQTHWKTYSKPITFDDFQCSCRPVLLGPDFSYFEACHKSLWKPIPNPSNLMDSHVWHIWASWDWMLLILVISTSPFETESDVWHFWAPRIWFSYSEALHQSHWKTYRKPITFDDFQCPWPRALLGPDFSSSEVCHKSIGKPIRNLSNSMDSHVWPPQSRETGFLLFWCMSQILSCLAG